MAKIVFKKEINIIIIALLLGITIFSAYKYIESLTQRQDLIRQLDQIRVQLTGLEKEKQNLLGILEKEKELNRQSQEENSALKGNLKTEEEKLVKLENDLSQTQKAVEDLNSQVRALQADNSNLKAEKEKLSLNISETAKENEALKTKLNSVTELKKAINELKKQARQVGKQIKKKVNKERASQGNQGFIVKNGKPTYPAKVVIEVNPAPNK